jgi:hypothetical protein
MGELLMDLYHRWPWLPAALGLGCLVAATCACASVSTAPGYTEVQPGLRILAVCQRGRDTEVLAYPISATFAGQNVVLGAVAGAALGAIAGPEGAAVGAGVGTLVGVLVDLVRALRGGPDPVPRCWT